jgi:hypothetical protein
MCKLIRCIKRCLKKKDIIIVRSDSILPSLIEPQLLIIKHTLENGTADNTVYLTGYVNMVLFELFELEKAHWKPTPLGSRYGAEMLKNCKHILIGKPYKLKGLCKALHIRKVFIIRY